MRMVLSTPAARAGLFWEFPSEMGFVSGIFSWGMRISWDITVMKKTTTKASGGIMVDLYIYVWLVVSCEIYAWKIEDQSKYDRMVENQRYRKSPTRFAHSLWLLAHHDEMSRYLKAILFQVKMMKPNTRWTSDIINPNKYHCAVSRL